MLNYKQLLTYFSSIAWNHEQIKSFGIGDLKQLTNDIETKKEPQYTRMYVIPQSTEFNENHIHYNFAILIYDKVEEDLSNLQEVLSDTLEIQMDIWTVFWQSYTQAEGNFSKIVVGDWEPDIQPFTERFETTLAGWTMQLRLSAPFDYNSCVLPIASGFTFPQDESYSSYFQVVNDWKQFAQYHEQVRSFGFGDIHQLTMNVETKQEPLYPRMYFVPSTAKLNQSHMHITWQVIVCDKLEEDYSNQQDVLSDCLEICKDFYAKAYLSDYDVEWNATLEPWLERTESVLAGWTLTISIQQKFDYNRCVLPIDCFADGITWEQLQQWWIEVNQQWEELRNCNIPTPTIEPSATPSPTPTSTETPTPTPTTTPTLTPTQTNTPTPSVTPTLTPTNTLTPTLTPTPTSTPPPVYPGELVLYVDANQSASYTSGNTWYDLTNYNNDVYLTGITANPTFVNSTIKYFNVNASFVNNKSFFYAENSASLQFTTGFTFEFWVYVTLTNNSYKTFLNKANPANSWSPPYGDYAARLFSDNLWEVWGNSYFNRASFSTSSQAGAWKQLVLTYDKNFGGYSLYNNGVKISDSFTYNGNIGTSNNRLYIGYSLGDELFTGNMSIIRLYNKKLSDTEVLNNFNADKATFGL